MVDRACQLTRSTCAACLWAKVCDVARPGATPQCLSTTFFSIEHVLLQILTARALSSAIAPSDDVWAGSVCKQ